MQWKVTTMKTMLLQVRSGLVTHVACMHEHLICFAIAHCKMHRTLHTSLTCWLLLKEQQIWAASGYKGSRYAAYQRRLCFSPLINLTKCICLQSTCLQWICLQSFMLLSIELAWRLIAPRFSFWRSTRNANGRHLPNVALHTYCCWTIYLTFTCQQVQASPHHHACFECC